MKIDTIKDVSDITGIDKKYLDKILKVFQYSIAEDITELNLNIENVIDLDIGIGLISIKVEDDTIKYKFTPNDSFVDIVKNAIKYKKNVLEYKLETSLCQKIEQMYRDLF